MTEKADLYREAAQQLLKYDETIVSEYTSTGEPEARYAAQQLYERHGPFELEFARWRWDEPPEWYNGPTGDD